MPENDEQNFEEILEQSKFKMRFSLVKEGKDAIKTGNPSKASKMYTRYLENMAEHYEVDLDELGPDRLPKDLKVSELIIMSQVSYELSRICDLSKHSESREKTSLYLGIFERLTIDSKFQSMNIQLLRKHLNKTRFNNKELFEDCLDRITQKSGFCFISSYAFGYTTEITEHFRSLKKYLPKKFTQKYYIYSPRLVKILNRNKKAGLFVKHTIIQPVLYTLYLLTKKVK